MTVAIIFFCLLILFLTLNISTTLCLFQHTDSILTTLSLQRWVFLYHTVSRLQYIFTTLYLYSVLWLSLPHSICTLYCTPSIFTTIYLYPVPDSVYLYHSLSLLCTVLRLYLPHWFYLYRFLFIDTMLSPLPFFSFSFYHASPTTPTSV